MNFPAAQSLSPQKLVCLWYHEIWGI